MKGWKVTGLWKTIPGANNSSAAAMSLLSAAWRKRVAAFMTRCASCLGYPRRLSVGFAPDLDRDLLDGQRDRRLRLARLDPDSLELVVGQQPVGDRAAQPLERPVGALLGDQGNQLADLGVVD